MKTIIAICRALFAKLWVSPRMAFVILLGLCFLNSMFLFSTWVIVYALMYYGHEISVAAEDYSNYGRFVPYAEADLRFKDAVAPSFFKAMAVCAAVFTGNYWLLPICYLMTSDGNFFNAYINRGFRYVVVL